MSLESSSCLTMYGSNKLERKKEDKKKRARERRIVERGAEIVVRKRELIETCQRWVAWCGTHSRPHGPPPSHLSYIRSITSIYSTPHLHPQLGCMYNNVHVHASLRIQTHPRPRIYISPRFMHTYNYIIIYILLYYSIYIYIICHLIY